MTVISYIYNNKFFSFMTTDITHTQVAGGGCILGMKNIKLSWKTIWEEVISKGNVLSCKSPKEYTYRNRFL